MRVLILGQNFADKSGGGVTMRFLFSLLNRENVSLATTTDSFVIDDLLYCKEAYVFGFPDFNYIIPFLGKNRISKIYSAYDTNTAIFTNFNSFKSNQILSRFIKISRRIGFYIFLRKLVVTDEFLKWFDENKFTVVYSQIGSYYYLKFITQLIKKRKFNLVIHNMDDWPKTINGTSFFGQISNYYIDKNFRFICKNAVGHLAISKFMAEAYEERYGFSWNYFHNGISQFFFKYFEDSYLNEDLSMTSTFNFLYAGRIGLANYNSIINTIYAINSINKKFSFKIQFNIVSPDVELLRNIIKNFDFVSCSDFIPQNELLLEYKKADVLVLPIDFSKFSKSFTRYSFPTKLVEYLVCSSHVFILAPSTALFTTEVSIFDSVHVCNKSDILEIENSIYEMVTKICNKSFSLKSRRNYCEQFVDFNLQNRFFTYLKLHSHEK